MKKFIFGLAILITSLSSNAQDYQKEQTKSCSQDWMLICDLADSPITGTVSTYYPNGSLESEKNYTAGNLNGPLKDYFENGNLRQEINFKNGQYEGLATYYNEDGSLVGKTNFKNGKKDGLQTLYYRNGSLNSETLFKNDKENGIKKTYYDNGALASESYYENGERVGSEKRYFDNGKPMRTHSIDENFQELRKAKELNAQTESCYCQKFGAVVPSSQQCAGQCYPAERIRKQDKDCTCFVWITKIDDMSYYTGQHDCSCHAFNRPIEGNKDAILKSLQEEYPNLPDEYNIDPSFMRIMFGIPEENH